VQHLQGRPTLNLRHFLAGVLFATASLGAIALPRHAPVPGGVAVVDLGPAGNVVPTVRWGDQPIAVVRADGHWFALIGIPLDSLPGDFEIGVFFGSTVAIKRIAIAVKNYPEQRLTIKDKRKVEPNSDDLARIEREQKVTEAIKRQFSATAPATDFILPAKGRLSSRFGLRRFFNGRRQCRQLLFQWQHRFHRPRSGLDHGLHAPFTHRCPHRPVRPKRPGHRRRRRHRARHRPASALGGHTQ